ncbi:xylose isomerase [Spirochaetia bacterium]|nr:xylose isomerase [Spirochaetia bacterium]
MAQVKRAVSLYSYQDEYCRKRMSLNDIFDDLDTMGVEGVEFISDQMLKGTPFPSAEELAQWDKVTGSHKVKPICNDVFINMTLFNNRVLRKKEAVASLENDIHLAKRLGFPLIRLVSLTPPDIVEACLECAEKENIVMALEIHAGLSFDNPSSKAFTDMMFRVKSPLLGLVVDTGIFCRKHPKIATDFFLSLGLNPAIPEYIDRIFEQGSDPKQWFKNGIPADLEKLIKTQTDREYVIFSDGYENSPCEIMDTFLPYIKHIHGKCYGFKDDGEEYSISFGEIIRYLYRKGYDGYISTEYEGNRFVPVGGVADGKSNVHIHQALLKKYIDECEQKEHK